MRHLEINKIISKWRKNKIIIIIIKNLKNLKIKIKMEDPIGLFDNESSNDDAAYFLFFNQDT